MKSNTPLYPLLIEGTLNTKLEPEELTFMRSMPAKQADYIPLLIEGSLNTKLEPEKLNFMRSIPANQAVFIPL